MKKPITNVEELLSNAGAALVNAMKASQVAMKAGTGCVRRQYRGSACRHCERDGHRQVGVLVEQQLAHESEGDQHGDDRVAVLPQPGPPGHALTVGRGLRSPGHPRE